MKKINFEKAIKFPVSHKEWMKYFGMYALISFIIYSVPQIISTVAGLGNYSINIFERLNSSSQALFSLLPALSEFTLTLLFIPVTLYLAGYLFEIQRRVFLGGKTIWTEHGDVWRRIKSGLRYHLAVNGPYIVLALLVSLFAAGIVVALSISDAVTFGLTARIVIATLAIVFVIFLMVFTALLPLINGGLMYTYMNTLSFKKTYNWKNFKSVVRSNWKELYIVALLNYAVSAIGGFLTIFTLCLAFFTAPIIQAYTQFISAYLYADLFKQLKKDIKLV